MNLPFWMNDLAQLLLRLSLVVLLGVVAWKIWLSRAQPMAAGRGRWTWKDTEKLFMVLLALTVLAWNIGISFLIMLKPPSLAGMDPASQAQVLTLVGGTVRSADLAAGIVLGYYFGTSKSSADKNELMAGNKAVPEGSAS